MVLDWGAAHGTKLAAVLDLETQDGERLDAVHTPFYLRIWCLPSGSRNLVQVSERRPAAG